MLIINYLTGQLTFYSEARESLSKIFFNNLVQAKVKIQKVGFYLILALRSCFSSALLLQLGNIQQEKIFLVNLFSVFDLI